MDSKQLTSRFQAFNQPLESGSIENEKKLSTYNTPSSNLEEEEEYTEEEELIEDGVKIKNPTRMQKNQDSSDQLTSIDFPRFIKQIFTTRNCFVVVIISLVCGFFLNLSRSYFFPVHLPFYINPAQFLSIARPFRINQQAIAQGLLPFDQTFCLNLDRRPKKWLNTVAELRNASVNLQQVARVSAIDGTTIPREAAIQLIKAGIFASLGSCKKSKRIFNGSVSVGQLGHYLSFRQIFLHALDRGMKAILVIEDDIMIRDPETFVKDVWEAYAELPPNWDFWYLYIHEHTGRTKPYSKHLQIPLGNEEGSFWGTAAIALSENGMKTFLAHGFPMEWQSDILIGYMIQSRTNERQGKPPLNAFITKLMKMDTEISDTSNIPGVWAHETLGHVCNLESYSGNLTHPFE